MPYDPDKVNPAMAYMGIGFEFIGIILGTTLIGFGADSYFELSPWLMLSGLFVGFFYGIYYLYRRAGQLAQALNEAAKNSPARKKKISDRADSVSRSLDEIGDKIEVMEKNMEVRRKNQ